MAIDDDEKRQICLTSSRTPSHLPMVPLIASTEIENDEDDDTVAVSVV